MRDGAFDYLTKPFNLPLLLATVERAVKQRALARTFVVPTVAPSGEKALVGSSAAMLGIWKLIGRAAASTASVLITGETGVGKELVASAIHDYSVRADERFIAVNLAALPATLIESELFGHEKGAFTGANVRRLGRFELAAGGTLFLDEIGDLDPSLQTKLLRVLQDGTFERVGGSEKLTAKARIIAATNKAVHPGEPGCVMREDLYYRLAVIDIEVPPLRARKSDIPLLVAHALKDMPARAASEQAMEALVAYGWPGNVRELVHVIERAAVLGGEIIDVASLPEGVRNRTGRTSLPPVSQEPASLRDAVSGLEKRMIVEALARAHGNRSEAARQLGIGRPQLYAKMEEHGIKRRRSSERGGRAAKPRRRQARAGRPPLTLRDGARRAPSLARGGARSRRSRTRWFRRGRSQPRAGRGRCRAHARGTVRHDDRPVQPGVRVLLDPALDQLHAAKDQLVHAIYDVSVDRSVKVSFVSVPVTADAASVTAGLPLLTRDINHQRGTFAAADVLVIADPAGAQKKGVQRLRLGLDQVDDTLEGVDAPTGDKQRLLGNYGMLFRLALELPAPAAAALAPRGGSWSGVARAGAAKAVLLPTATQSLATTTDAIVLGGVGGGGPEVKLLTGGGSSLPVDLFLVTP